VLILSVLVLRKARQFSSLEVVIAAVGVVLSISASMFVAGSRRGRIEGDRLAKIEGMFTLRLRDGIDDEHRQSDR
jgi:hypothetical protein